MSGGEYRTSDFAYELPAERIAQAPTAQRDQSRLLVLDRARHEIHDRSFRDLVEMVPAGDALVLNETRVFPARLLGRRESGAEAEILLLHPAGDGLWSALVRPGAKLRQGRRVMVGSDLVVEIVGSQPEAGTRTVRLRSSLSEEEALARYGHVPLPPYIHRSDDASDQERYQTVYATEGGSVAAPTAGLHFTTDLLRVMEGRGVRIVRLVLHVGVGTFRPVEVEDPGEHRMHSERYRMSAAAAISLNQTRAAGGKLWAVGTTSARTLETTTDAAGVVHAGEGWTDLFIRPPYRFRGVDRLVTNFHLPRSTLLMLVAAFGGYQWVMEAYRHAVREEYRFFSYGDAMVVL